MPGAGNHIMWNELIRFSKTSNATLQQQLREAFVAVILDGKIPADQPLPSSRLLAKQLQVSRNTVIISYQTLLDDGYIVSKERRGYFVNSKMLEGRVKSKNLPIQPETTNRDWESKLKRKPSIKRNIEKPSDWRGYKYPFIYGQPDQAVFPMSQWRDCARQSLNASDIYSSGYDRFDLDDPVFIEQIQARLLPRRGVWAKNEEILVTLGAQHSLYIIASLLSDRTSTVAIESPGYPDARNIFLVNRSKIAPVSVDAEGIIVDKIPGNCDCVFVTPSHQSPSTVTLSKERRIQLLSKASRDDFIIIEDDYEAEANYRGDPIPALKSQDTDNRVIYVGSLSKTLAPGLRMGYMVGPTDFIKEARALRRLMVRHTPANNQRTVALFLARGHHDVLIQQLNEVYRERWSHMVSALNQYFPGACTLPTFGGSAFWVQGNPRLNTVDLAKQLRSNSVLIEPGFVYFESENLPQNYFRLGFSSIASDRIGPGIQLIADAVSAQLKTKQKQ